MTGTFARLRRLWRLTTSGCERVAIIVLQSRFGRFTQAVIEGTVARG